MSTQKALSAQSVKNNGGSVINGGTSASTRNPIASRRNSSNTNLGVFGSTVVRTNDVTSSTTSTYFAVTKGVLAQRVKSININDALVSGAADPVNRRSINRLEVVRTLLWSTAFRAGLFNFYTGKFQTGYPQVTNDSAMLSSGGVYQDKAGNPTRQVPGELVFKGGAKVPVMKNYPSKNG